MEEISWGDVETHSDICKRLSHKSVSLTNQNNLSFSMNIFLEVIT